MEKEKKKKNADDNNNSSARFHKSPRKMIIDAEINLTIIGQGETFSNKQAGGARRRSAVDHRDHSWIVPQGGIFISAQQMGGMRFSPATAGGIGLLVAV